MRLYIAGPMSNYPEYNYPEFNKAQKRLEAAGYEVINPARQGFGLTYEEYLKRAIADVFECDGIAMLKNWHLSPGAQAEIALADALKKDTSMVSVWITLKVLEAGRAAN